MWSRRMASGQLMGECIPGDTYISYYHALIQIRSRREYKLTLRRRPTVGVAVSHVHQPPNIPGKTWLGLTVTAPVNAGEYHFLCHYELKTD